MLQNVRVAIGRVPKMCYSSVRIRVGSWSRRRGRTFRGVSCTLFEINEGHLK